MYSVVGNILLIIPVLSCKFSACTCNNGCLSCLIVAGGFGANSRNFCCNMGATQPILNISSPTITQIPSIVWIWYSPSFLQLHSIVWLWHLQLILLWFIQWISSLLPCPPHLSSFPVWFVKLVCWDEMCGVLFIHQLFTCWHTLCLYSWSHLPVFALGEIQPLSLQIFPAWYILYPGIVIATVLDSHFGSGSGSRPNHCQIGGPGCRQSRTINLGTCRWKSPNQTESGGLLAGPPAGPSIASYKALVVGVW